MKSFKESIISNFKSQFDLRLKKSTWINDLQQALSNFPELGSFQAWGKELINEVDNQLKLLAKLELQINHFNNNQINLIAATAEIEASFRKYDELEAKNEVSLLKPITEYTLLYCKEKNGFFKELSEKKLPFILASLHLNDQNDFDVQFDSCIQLIKNHIKNPEKLLNFFDIIKHSYLNQNEPNLSYFIFTAHEQAIKLLENSIKKNLLELNLQQIKSECENPSLYNDLYQNSLILLANHYQDYSNKLDMIKNKLEFLNKHLGEPVKDWLYDYTTLSDTTFLSEATPEILVEKCNHLSSFATQLSLNNDKEFLKKIKKKTQDFLNSKINNLEEHFQNSQTQIAELANTSPLAACIADKLRETQKSHYSAIKKIWLKRKKRLENISVVEELKNFKEHFSKENPFDSNSLNFKELHAAILLLKESDLALQTEMFIQALSKIPLESLAKKIFFILENLNDTLLSSSVNNLLQFIHSENNKPKITLVAQAHLAISLQAFFNRQPSKMAVCIAHNAPLNEINTETYEKLITILRYTDSDKLEKCPNLNSSLRLKIKEFSARNEINQTIINQTIERLISTKKIIHLFEGKNTYTMSDSENNTFQYSLWDACCLFQQFAKNSFSSDYPYLKKLEKKTEIKDELFGFQNAVLHLDFFIRAIEKIANKSYKSTLFLKPGNEKQEYVNQLINNLKNIPIKQMDTSSINSIFEQWKKDHQLMIDEPRYRLLIKLCMLIYRQFMKIFFPASNCFTTTSHQTIIELQEEFLKASEHLQNLRNNFSYSVHAETTAASLPTFTP